jgi:hypothetical protein
MKRFLMASMLACAAILPTVATPAAADECTNVPHHISNTCGQVVDTVEQANCVIELVQGRPC